MTQWDTFLSTVTRDIEELAISGFSGFVNELKSDALSFVTTAQDDLKLWTQQLANGEITEANLTEFVQADAALAEMAAITQAGIAAADLQRFRDAVVNAVTTAAISAFKI